MKTVFFNETNPGFKRFVETDDGELMVLDNWSDEAGGLKQRGEKMVESNGFEVERFSVRKSNGFYGLYVR